MCLIDLTGQNREFPGLNRELPGQNRELPGLVDGRDQGEVTGGGNSRQRRLQSIDELLESDFLHPWKVGFSETAGSRNKYEHYTGLTTNIAITPNLKDRISNRKRVLINKRV